MKLCGYLFLVYSVELDYVPILKLTTVTMKQQIINDIISELIIEKCASTFKSYLTDEYYHDFILEMYLQLFDINEDKLIKLYNKNQLIYYIIAMCRNNATNSKSKFWRLHRSKVELIYIEDYKLIFDNYEDS